MSIADIDRRLAEISTETMAIVTAASLNGGQSSDDTLKLKELVDEAALLKEKKKFIQSEQGNNPSASHRLAKAAEMLEEVDNHITHWDECMIRQLVETVKVISATKIEVSLQGGVVIEQEVKEE